MRLKLTAIIAPAIVLVSSLFSSPLGWRPDVYIGNPSIISYSIAGGEVIHIACSDYYNNKCGGLRYKRSFDGGIVWETGGSLPNESNFSIRRYNLHLVAKEGLLGLTWYTKGINSSGDIINFANSYNGGDTWSDRYDVGWGSNSVLTRGDSLFHTVWESNRVSENNYEIYYCQSTDNGITWEAPTNPDSLDGSMRLTVADRNSWHPAIATNYIGVYVVWADEREENNYEIYYNQSLDGGITWTHGLYGRRLTERLGTSEFPSISTYGNSIVIVWQDNRNGLDEIFFKRSTDNGVNWETDTYISAGRRPSITCDEDGVHIVWSDDVSETNSEIFYIQSTDWGTTRESVIRLTYAEGSSESPKIIADDWGRHVIWKDSRDNNSLYYKQNDIIPPSAPTGLYVDAIGLYPRYATVIFDWLDNSEPDLDEYYAYRRRGGQSWEWRGSSCESYWQDNCNYDTHYWYYVTAVDMAKNESAVSNIVHVYVPCPGSMMIGGIGNITPSPYLVQRTGYRNWGHSFEYIVDYDTEELIYRFQNLNPRKEYLLTIIHYKEDTPCIQSLRIDSLTLFDNFLVTNRPGFNAIWIPQETYEDSIIQVNIHKVTGDDVVISEIILGEFDETFEIYGRNGGGTQTAGSNTPITYYISVSPNPAKNDMTISFGIPREEMVSLNVYDVTGREVKKLVDSKFEAGYHTIKLNHMSLPSGIYFARLVTDGFNITKKIVLIQ